MALRRITLQEYLSSWAPPSPTEFIGSDVMGYSWALEYNAHQQQQAILDALRSGRGNNGAQLDPADPGYVIFPEEDIDAGMIHPVLGIAAVAGVAALAGAFSAGAAGAGGSAAAPVSSLGSITAPIGIAEEVAMLGGTFAADGTLIGAVAPIGATVAPLGGFPTPATLAEEVAQLGGTFAADGALIGPIAPSSTVSVSELATRAANTVRDLVKAPGGAGAGAAPDLLAQAAQLARAIPGGALASLLGRDDSRGFLPDYYAEDVAAAQQTRGLMLAALIGLGGFALLYLVSK